MKMKSFILKYASKIMFYDVNIACYQCFKSFFFTRDVVKSQRSIFDPTDAI